LAACNTKQTAKQAENGPEIELPVLEEESRQREIRAVPLYLPLYPVFSLISAQATEVSLPFDPNSRIKLNLSGPKSFQL
jgi:hypothetical protein